MEYKLLSGNFEYEIENQVNKLLADGRSIYGNITILKRTPDHDGVELTDFYQATIKNGTPVVGMIPEAP